MKVTVVKNSKLLYLPAESFHSLFEELELKKLRQFCETHDEKEIQRRILQNWKHRKTSVKQIHEITASGQSKKLKEWHTIADQKGTSNREVISERARITVINRGTKREKVDSIMVESELAATGQSKSEDSEVEDKLDEYNTEFNRLQKGQKFNHSPAKTSL